MSFYKTIPTGLKFLPILLPLFMSFHSKAASISKEEMKIEAVIERYISQHPELIVNTLVKFQQDIEKQKQANLANAIKMNMNALHNNENDPFMGNPNGDVVLVEFFDYQCGHCRRLHPTIQQLLEQDKNVKVVFKQLPILSESSLIAAKASLAAKQQGKFAEMHNALFSTQNLGEEIIDSIANNLQLDVALLRKTMAGEQIETQLSDIASLAKTLQINGTPAILIQDSLYPGALGLDVITEIIAQKRNLKIDEISRQ